MGTWSTCEWSRGRQNMAAGLAQAFKNLSRHYPRENQSRAFIHFCPIPDLGSPAYDLRPYFVVNCKDRKFNCEFFSASGAPAGQRLTSFDKPSSFSDHAMIRPMTIPPGDTSSVEAFCTLKRWISRCHADHSHCEFTGPTTLPHRVLEIESLQPLRVVAAEVRGEGGHNHIMANLVISATAHSI